MLDELDIRNFAIIDHLHVRFAPGLTVLTGETGAGKSILIDALGLLLGGRAGADLIREGATQARVEGIFALSDDAVIQQTLEVYGVASDEGGLILSRELSRAGRGTARVNGRAVPLTVLQALGSRLVDIHGQTEHLALLRAADQLEILDRFAGLGVQREQLAGLVRRLRASRAELAKLARDEREAARRLDLLRFQVEEIDRAALSPGEEEALAAEVRLLAGAEKRREAATELYAALAGGDADATAAEDVLGAAARLAMELARLDPDQAAVGGRIDAALSEVQDLARDLRRYAEGVEENPERLKMAQDRQELLRALKRKYGASIAEVLTFREEAATEAAAIAQSDERRAALEQEVQALLEEAGRCAATLSSARQQAAMALAERVQRELAGLHMRGARFQVQVRQQPDPDGLPLPSAEGQEPRTFAFDASGIDQAEFMVSPNVGESLKPVARIASGGETSRIMLALKAALAEADQTATLIFDEVDVGVGGRSGQVIGEKLWQLAHHHQVICITHLPQVAAYGDQHQRLRKLVRDERTATAVELLEPESRVDEVAQMLGGTLVTPTTRQASHDLLEGARRWKTQEAEQA